MDEDNVARPPAKPIEKWKRLRNYSKRHSVLIKQPTKIMLKNKERERTKNVRTENVDLQISLMNKLKKRGGARGGEHMHN